MSLRRFFFGLVGISFVVFLPACSATPEHRSFGQVIDDAVITSKLKAKFVKDPLVKAIKIDVDTARGVVSLAGKLNKQDEIDRALAIARSQPGVRAVKDYLVLQGLPAGKIGTLGEKDLGSSPGPALDLEGVSHQTPQKDEKIDDL